jgi:hypothetical protein
MKRKGALRLGSSFEWCVIRFAALGFDCRVLVVLNTAKEKFEAIYAVQTDEGLRVLFSYEYHPDVPTGWHCHACCDDISKVPVETIRGPWVKRIPAARRTHRLRDLGIDDHAQAVHAAVDHYRIFEKGPLL